MSQMKILIPQVIRKYANGKSELHVEGDSVRAALRKLKTQHPKLYECICDETDSLRPHINLFINDQLLPRSEEAMNNQLEPESVVSVFQAVSGG